MVSKNDVVVAVIDRQFARFMKERVRIHEICDMSNIPEDIRKTAFRVVCVNLFNHTIKETARYN